MPFSPIVPSASFASSFDLRGRVALVGGASQGIGRAAAERLAEMGAQVILLARSPGPLEEARQGLPGESHSVLACDVGNRAELSRLVGGELQRRGGIDILVCNAGGPKAGLIQDANEEQFLSAFSQHVLANSTLAQLCLPRMKERGWGRIVNVISTSVRIPIPSLGVSNTVRAAVAAWAKTLSLEVGPFGVTVNSVLPGYTLTPRLESLLEAAAFRAARPRAEVEAEWRATIPAGRFGDPAEIAAAIGFLASPAASYINGISLPVDGGRTGSL
jgi:3-oxoacyl-[acyl-carrier protein] reductase